MCIRKSTFPAFQLENENMQLLMREPMWAMGRERRETLIAFALGTLHAPGLGSGWLSGCADKSQSTPCHDSLTWDDDMCLRPSARCLTCCCSLLSPAASLSPDTQVSVHLHLCIQGQLHSAPLGLVLPTVLLLVHTGVLVMETPRSRQLSGTILLPRMCCTVPACSKHQQPFGFVPRALFSSQRQISVWPADSPSWLFPFSICGFHTCAVVLTAPSSCTRTASVNLFLCKMHCVGTVGPSVTSLSTMLLSQFIPMRKIIGFRQLNHFVHAAKSNHYHVYGSWCQFLSSFPN